MQESESVALPLGDSPITILNYNILEILAEMLDLSLLIKIKYVIIMLYGNSAVRLIHIYLICMDYLLLYVEDLFNLMLRQQRLRII